MTEYINCSYCGSSTGAYYVSFNGRVLVMINTLVFSDAHGYCGSCGAEWHWSSSEKQLEELIARQMELRNIKNELLYET